MYSTVDRLLRNIKQYTNDEPDALLTEKQAEEIILDSDAIIDAILRGKYSIPFVTVPRVIKTLSEKMSKASAMQEINTTNNSAIVDPEDIKAINEEVNTMLHDLKTGALKLENSSRLRVNANTYII